jgi:hypothetical protein
MWGLGLRFGGWGRGLLALLGLGDRPCSFSDTALRTLGTKQNIHLRQHPDVRESIFEVICSKIRLASHFEQLFYEYGSNRCS